MRWLCPIVFSCCTHPGRYDALDAPAREAVDALFAETGLSALVTTGARAVSNVKIIVRFGDKA